MQLHATVPPRPDTNNGLCRSRHCRQRRAGGRLQDWCELSREELLDAVGRLSRERALLQERVTALVESHGARSIVIGDGQLEALLHEARHHADTRADLEDQLVRVLEKNTELTIQNTDLQKQVQHLQNVSGEGRGLPGAAPPSKQGGDTLESILKQMREATERRKELEQEHADALTQLREKQGEFQRNKLVSSSGEKSKSYETIEALQSKIRELEKKTELQNVHHEELMLEMASIKRTAQGAAAAAQAAGSSNVAGSGSATGSTVGSKLGASVAWKGRTGSTNQEVQTSPESGTSTPDSGRSGRMDSCGTARSTPMTATMDALLDPHQTGVGTRTMGTHMRSATVPAGCGVPPPSLQHPFLGLSGMLWRGPETYHAGSGRACCSTRGPLALHPPNSLPLVPAPGPGSHQGQGTPPVGRTGSPVPGQTSAGGGSEIERIMAKIEQDNRILAELDKTRSTIGDSLQTSSPQHQPHNKYLTVPQITYGPNHSAEPPEASGLTAGTPAPPPPGTTLVTDNLGRAGTGMVDPMTGYMTATMMPMGPPVHQVQTLQYQQPQPQQYVLQPVQNYVQHQARLMPQIPAGVGPPTIPTILTTQYDLDTRNNFLNGNLVMPAYQDQQQQQHQLSMSDNKLMDMLDVPGKGRCFVFIARYSYDPLTQSPNENPEAELAVNAGDYVLVWGSMDEDGFCDGELLDGRRGLVPSNFIQKLVGDDLLEFHQSVVQGLLRDCDDSASTNVAHEVDLATAAHDVVMMDEALSKQRSLGDYTFAELEDILEEEDESLSEQTGEGPVPPPKQLTLERQLNKSVLIGWNAPDACPPSAIDSYHVYVDGVLKTTVKATERTRALVEGVDSTRPHRISVRSITPNRRTSRDAACTMVIGKDVPLGPSNVKASNLTSTSAVISWLPANSNHQHVVCVNNVEVRTVKPGVYRHTITGLAPNTVYRVTVRAKNIRAPSFDEKTSLQMERFSAHIDFRTLPKGLPDPPVDIQVEPGPQDGTLLVTWLPVAPATQANNGAPVTGYAVYADGKKVTDVDSPTGDHALIDINKLLGLNPKQVTVRTKSRDSQSSDSAPTAIPSNALKGKMSKDGVDMMKSDRDRRQRERYGSAVPAHMRHHQTGQGHRTMRVDAHGQVIIDTDENLSDKEIYPANHINIPSIEITKDSASEGNFSEDDYLDGRRGARGHHHHQGSHYDPRSANIPRSHAERGRPPLLPHERGRMDHMPPRRDRDDRDQYYMDSRSRHAHPGDRGYRGPPPGRGMVSHHGGPPPGPHGPGPSRDKRTRWFVALFDYDPTTMSPNPDACEEELPFSESDPIKIYGEKDADGFYWGECRGRRGYVPHNMVVEVQEMPKSRIHGEGGDPGRGPHGGPHSRDRWGDIYANMPVKKMIALYDYDPQELSPNVDAEVELSFNTGNIIYVYGEMDDDGFYMGELDGIRGLVPSNFLTEAPPDYNGRDRRGGPGQDRRGGPAGPGARGPPPPPRDGPRMDPRDRRKDACPVPSQLDYRGDAGPQGPRARGGPRGVDRRGGSHMDPPPPSSRGPGPGMDPMHQPPAKPPAEQIQQQQQQSNKPPMKGVPSVVPDFVIPNNKESPTAPTAPSVLPKLPDAPNLMQKFTEMTGGADDIISKGKELIFMKFGLGK